MKLFFDILPVALFFGVYTLNKDIFLATKLLMLLSLAQMAWLKWHGKVIDNTQKLSFLFIMVLGGATLVGGDATFIMWKPTALYWCLAVLLLLSRYVFGKQPLQALFAEAIVLSEPRLWDRLLWHCCIFFIIMGAINLSVAYLCSEATWVSFKLFGTSGLLIVFVILQWLWLSRYIKTPPTN